MAVRTASRALQVLRVVLAVVLTAAAVACATAGQWLLAALLAAAVVGSVTAFRRGTWDPEEAKQAGKDYAYPRLVGAAIGLVVFVVAAALGLLD